MISLGIMAYNEFELFDLDIMSYEFFLEIIFI